MNIGELQAVKLTSISQIISHVSYRLRTQSEVTVSYSALLYRHMSCWCEQDVSQSAQSVLWVFQGCSQWSAEKEHFCKRGSGPLRHRVVTQNADVCRTTVRLYRYDQGEKKTRQIGRDRTKQVKEYPFHYEELKQAAKTSIVSHSCYCTMCPLEYWTGTHTMPLFPSTWKHSHFYKQHFPLEIWSQVETWKKAKSS